MNTTTVRGLKVNYINRDEFKGLKDEIFNQKIYNTQLDTETPIIIDAGAHIGLATLFFKNKYPNAKIVSIEPNPISFELLQMNLTENQFEDVEIINKALDSKRRIQALYIDPTDDRWDSSASFIPGGWKGGYNTRKIEVETITLSSVIANQEIDLLKLDIEGAEQRVLLETQEHLKRVKNIVIEFHPVKTQNIRKIIKLLRAKGFMTEVKGEELKIITAKAK